MNVFRGLDERQLGAIRHVRVQRAFAPGSQIFIEGDAASHLYIIIRGAVRITRLTPEGRIELARLGHNDVIGEIGLILASSFRTATAEAIEETHTLEIPVNVIELFRRVNDLEATMTILQNLVCVLGERLRRKDRLSPELFRGADPFSPFYKGDLKHALETIEASLPKGFLSIFAGNKKLKPGEILCEQDSKPDGFYCIHKGELEVIQREGGMERELGRIAGPTITGEIGFFSGEPRTATLRAATEVEYTRFSGADFERLKKKDPEHAFQVLSAAAQFAVHLIVKREGEA